MAPLRLLLDVSPIGAAPESRTGLARVALALARALTARDDVDLRSCAWGSIAATADFASVRREFPELQGLLPTPGFLERACLRLTGAGRPRLPGALSRIVGQVANRCRNPLAGVDLATFDVVHSTYARFPRVVRRRGLPSVMTLHDLMPLRMPAHWFSAGQAGVTRRIVAGARQADRVVCISESTRRDFLDDTGYPPERAVVIHNGIDHGIFHPETDGALVGAVLRKHGLEGVPFVLTLSSLAPHKNLRMLLDAWRRRQEGRPGSLVIAGGQTKDVASLARGLAIGDDVQGVVVTGHVSDTEFRALATACQAFVFPSLYEGFGLPALEAMACGAPVIAADRTSLPEVVGAAGTLLDPTDESAWEEQVGRALAAAPRDRPHGPSLERAAGFSWERSAAAYAALYRRLTG
ncbi:MAG: glycosyltransferase family 4 protein [Planctomycetaceae bacterium]